MKISEEELKSIIIEELEQVLKEKCFINQIDRSIVHKGSGVNRKSYIQVKTVKLCDDNITTPEERADIRKKQEQDKKKKQKEIETARRKWRQEKDKLKYRMARPDKSS